MPKLQYIQQAQTSPPASDGPFVGVHTEVFGLTRGSQRFIGTDIQEETVEGNVQYALSRGGTLKFGRLRVQANTFNGSTDVTIRINGTPVMSVTVPSATAGVFQLSPAEVSVNEGDLLSVGADTSPSSSGSFVGVAVTYLVED